MKPTSYCTPHIRCARYIKLMFVYVLYVDQQTQCANYLNCGIAIASHLHKFSPTQGPRNWSMTAQSSTQRRFYWLTAYFCLGCQRFVLYIGLRGFYDQFTSPDPTRRNCFVASDRAVSVFHRHLADMPSRRHEKSKVKSRRILHVYSVTDMVTNPTHECCDWSVDSTADRGHIKESCNMHYSPVT